MPIIFLPPKLRGIADSLTVEVDARNVREAITAANAKHPGIQDALLDDGELLPGMTVTVDGNVSSKGLLQPVRAESEIHFLPAIGGG